MRPLRREAVSGAAPQRLEHAQHGVGVDLVDRQMRMACSTSLERLAPLLALLRRFAMTLRARRCSRRRSRRRSASAALASRSRWPWRRAFRPADRACRPRRLAQRGVLVPRFGQRHFRVGSDGDLAFFPRGAVAIDPGGLPLADGAEVEAVAVAVPSRPVDQLGEVIFGQLTHSTVRPCPCRRIGGCPRALSTLKRNASTP